MSVVNIPNIITFIRIVIIPAFVTALIYKRYDYALLLFIIAAVSDTLDGLMARVTKQKTKLGAFLDPLADKSLLVTSFILFSVYDWVPTWLTITVISRDVIVTLGWFLLYLTSHSIKVEPSLIGKAAIASQLILIAYTLLSINFNNIPRPDNWMFWIVAVLTTVSGLQYIYRGLKQASEK
ncbi:MAG: CDP-alcohol phosphatidyltransferase family protein [Nitrospirae bacterium]|jgi:cardiolipin synthase|nr:CDP-alcohol phosphatidyltransferase family protein [Nitrospirota bacterium]MDA8215315.1 CDP-alcohol phosphatidyltransferase family protein [Nitrospiraceae bacterium]